MDKEYWNNYYLKHAHDKGISKNSSFSEFCEKKYFFNKELSIIELGSGNGRDAIYFAHHGHQVIAIDQSTTAIDMERSNISTKINSNLNPVATDFVEDHFNYSKSIDIFYSRFTLHAIAPEDEAVLLPHVYNALNDGGMFCVEARTTKDQMFGVGTYCGNNTYLTDHKRRFINSNEFLKTVMEMGFSLVYFTEENNLSVYKKDNPVLMRIILRKGCK
jgi:tellurite methyltransferase